MNKELEIKKLKREIASLKAIAHHDQLTGILNRRGFQEQAGLFFKAIVINRRQSEKRALPKLPFSLIFFDIDDFKKINDKYGHDTGDEALKFVVARVRDNLRESDIFGRWGGEEFVIALLGVDENAAYSIADKLRAAIAEKPQTYKRAKISITGSFGIASYGAEESLNDLVIHADKTMYYAKKKLSKNSVAKFSQIK